MGISGIGASPLAASPHIFAALSFVERPQSFAPSIDARINLTLAAQPAFAALLRIGATGAVTFQLGGQLPTGIPPLAQLGAQASIARTITNLAAARVYPSPIFTFHA